MNSSPETIIYCCQKWKTKVQQQSSCYHCLRHQKSDKVTSPRREILISLPLLLPTKSHNLADLPVLPTCGRMTCATNTSLTPLHNCDDTCCPLNVPPEGSLGAASQEGASRANGGVKHMRSQSCCLSPFKRNHSAPFISESRGSWQSVTTARYNMWWRFCSLLAWFPLQGKDLGLVSYETQLTWYCTKSTCQSVAFTEDPRRRRTQVCMWLLSKLHLNHTWRDAPALFNLLFNGSISIQY